MAIGLVLAAVASAPAFTAPGRPARMPPQAYRALVLRSQALNVLYGLGKPEAMTDAQYRATLIHGAALNERYGLPVAMSSDEIAQLYGTRASEVSTVSAPDWPTAATTATGGFDWTAASIGGAFVAGLLALGFAGALAVRRHGHIGHVGRP
jgi:hypothetical protein